MNHEELKAKLLQDPATREAYENPPLALTIARAVVLRRRELGISQEQLAAALGTSQNQVWRIESGHANITIETLGQLAKVLNIPVSALIPQERQPVRVDTHSHQAKYLGFGGRSRLSAYTRRAQSRRLANNQNSETGRTDASKTHLDEIPKKKAS